MNTQCKFCNSPEKSKLERQIVAGRITRVQAAAKIGANPASVTRHMKNHLPATVRAEIMKSEGRLAINVTAQIHETHDDVRTIIARALRKGNDKLALKAIEVELKTIELAAKLSGQLDERPTLNLLLDARYAQLRETVIEKLNPYPEARLALADALEKIAENESKNESRGSSKEALDVEIAEEADYGESR